MNTCAHETTEPVEVRDRTDGGTTVVARICVDCLDELPAGWGCPDCDFTDIRTFADPVPQLHLARPCPAHRGGI